MGESAGTRRRSIALVSRAVEVLAQVDAWPPETVAVGLLRDGAVVGSHGTRDRVFRWASVTKLVTAVAVPVATEGVAFLPRLAVAYNGSGILAWIARASRSRRIVRVALKGAGARFGRPSTI